MVRGLGSQAKGMIKLQLCLPVNTGKKTRQKSHSNDTLYIYIVYRLYTLYNDTLYIQYIDYIYRI